ncbi:molybdopterin biosynthesis protein [Thermodesulfatator autotrophicus]|uniref:Molybdopterin molybdenumtransferase n=1 Tax=Thermodesulfatator autotrophicus TaxID=1795632 RepID=A0A177E752_9BACT|nr:molybdopterin biosynthesis protein [Thermodesulfatator autotrophicus]OAG27618.1 LysR family transcriptional regulator [Thermodesulfatator autotrophicus]
MKRRIYLRKKSLEEAIKITLEAFPWKDFLKSESVPVKKALGRITAEAIYARRSVPAFNSAAMDGIAVQAEKTFGAHESHPLRLKIGKEAFFINTGEPLPSETNAVIMIEEVHQISKDEVEIMAPAFPWQHVRKIGEDVVEGELIFPPSHRLASWDLGALLATGHLEVAVKEKPRVAIIPTGDELISPEKATEELLKDGRTVEFNSTMITATIEEWGGEAQVFPIIPDIPEEIEKAIFKALEADFHLITVLAGSSAGSKDHTANLIEKEGELLFHGVGIMPGKPAILGRLKGKPVLGVPGYPVSAVIAFEKLMKPAFSAMLGVRLLERPKVIAKAGRKIPSRLGTREFLRVKVGEVAGEKVFMQLKRGAGAITTLTKADALCEIPEEVEGLEAGSKVTLEILRPEKDLARTALVLGSHDMALDIMEEFLKREAPEYDLSLAHLGSLGGLLALRDNLSHFGGTHLFDPETGEFNVPYIKRHLPETPLVLVHFAYREQGLIVPKGNPKKITRLEDLAREDVTFINRQPGAGTRVLLDYHLEKLGINPRQIKGYESEETTHLGVAIAVATGRADVGLGILAAARLLSLDFVPLFRERYDLVVRKDFFLSPFWQKIASILSSRAFQERVLSLGGYDVSEMGKVLYEQ